MEARDRAAFRGEGRPADEVHLAADSAVEMPADRVGADLAGQSIAIAELMAVIRRKLRITWVSFVKSQARISSMGLSWANR